MRLVAATLALTLAAAAFPAAAKQPFLALPIDCTLGETCYIQNFVDTDPGPGSADFTCAALTYDGHKGTDFGLPSLAAMQAGVTVRAAAPGTVLGVRDGMTDIAYTAENAAQIEDRECGNGVVIGHGGGWQTQYCHLKQGSVAVQKGDRVAMGAALGQVGLSGKTQFPHVHLSVRHDGAVIDPFNPDGTATCATPPAPRDTLWLDPPAYIPGGLLSAGFANAVPEFDAVKAGTAAAATLPADAPGLVLWGFAFGGRPGDILRLEIDGPQGFHFDHDVTFERDQAQTFRAAGKRLRAATWPAGTYSGRVTLLRDGMPISLRRTTVHIGG